MGKPRCLLLDEPSLGLAPKMVAELFRILRQICDQGTGVLLVEQNVRQALSVCNHAYILEHGQIVAKARDRTCSGASASESRTSGYGKRIPAGCAAS